MQSKESMDALSEILKDLVQDPIKSIYDNNISDDLEKVKARLKRIAAISDQINSVRQDFDSKHDDLESLLNRIIDNSKNNERLLADLIDRFKDINERLSVMADDTLKGNQNISILVEEKIEAHNKDSNERVRELNLLLTEIVKVNSELKSDNGKRVLRELEIIGAVRTIRWVSMLGFTLIIVGMVVLEFKIF